MRLFVLCCVLLVGCAQPGIVYKPVPVEVASPPVLCKVPVVTKAPLLLKSLTKDVPLDQKVATLLADRENMLAYEVQLEAALLKCQ